MKIDLKALMNEAALIDDHTKVSSGGSFEYTLPPEGKTVGRFIEYIELGKQKQRPYQGKERPAADEVRIVFELLGPTKNIKTIEINGEQREVADKMIITLPKKLNDKAKFTGLFKAMLYGRDDITHIGQMLGEAFIFTVVHNTDKKDPEKKYANIYKDKQWLIEPPFIVNPLSDEVTHVPVRDAISPERGFIQALPTKETWDSLFIDGTRTTKDAKGNEVEKSRNYLQETLLRAEDFDGSALQQMLIGADALPSLEDLEEEPEDENSVEEEPEEEEEEVEETKAPAPKAKPSGKTSKPTGIEAVVADKKAEKATKAPAATTVAKTTKPASAAVKKAPAPSSDDALRAMGLDF